MPGTQVILDDMIVMGKTDQEHLENLEMVFQGLSENAEKCKFSKRKSLFEDMRLTVMDFIGRRVKLMLS